MATDDGEPAVSRPAHKQDPNSNSSGKGKIDYIFAKGCVCARATCALMRPAR